MPDTAQRRMSPLRVNRLTAAAVAAFVLVSGCTLEDSSASGSAALAAVREACTKTSPMREYAAHSESLRVQYVRRTASNLRSLPETVLNDRSVAGVQLLLTQLDQPTMQAEDLYYAFTTVCLGADPSR